MRCPRCGAHSPAGKKFCGDCGAALAVICPSCGAANSAGEDFCNRCGAVLEAPGFWEASEPWSGADRSELPGELRPVTVLFCDIVDSTALTERLGAEAMRDLVHGFIEASLAEVHRFGGTAPQFRGDGFMALFGAPLTQEDHLRRALLAAMAIQRVVTEGEASRLCGADLKIRIGIHTGPVVFGAIGGSFPIKTAIGDTANVAARMEQAAAPGTILVSAAVEALAQGYARLEPVGRLTVKGKSKPIAAFRLLGVARWRAARDAVSPMRMTRFVGRGDDIALLQDLLRRTESGHGQVVGIVGDPGIGKSRVLAEFRRSIGEERVVWAEGRCLSYGAGIPYLLALDLLRSHCGIIETDSTEAIVGKVRAGLSAAGLDGDQDSPVLLHLLGVKNGGADAPAWSNPEAVKARSFEVLQRLCLGGGRRRPLVLVLEDVHWIDMISEELIATLADRVCAAPILLIATYRPEYRPPWAGNPKTAEIEVQPLSRDDSLYVVRSVLRNEEIAAPLAEQIVARADGNPLFIEQLALHAGETGSGHGELTVPQTIHGVVMARIDRLPHAAKQLLQTAAVIGREFSLRLLRAVWSGREPLEPRLRELARLEFLDEWPDDEGTSYVFRHALTQEAAYASLLERDRRRRHEEIGHALEELYEGRTDEVAELLALHFGRSNDEAKAVDYAIASGEKSQRRWANNEALTYFADALYRLDRLPDTSSNRLRRVDAVLKQAEAEFALGQHIEHIRALEKIREIVEQTNDPRRRAEWHYWIGFLHSLTGSRPEIAIKHCQEAAKIAANSGLSEINAFADSCLAQVYIVAGRPRDAIEAGERAVSSFEAFGNLWWAGRTLWHLASAANFIGEWDASRTYSRRALKYGISLNDARLKAVSWWRIGVAHIQQGDLERGQQCCLEAITLASNPRDAAMARAAHGYAEIKAGRIDAGIAELNEALDWFANSRLRFTYLNYALWLAEGHLLRGDCATARLLIDDVRNASRQTGYLHFEGRAYWLTAECLAAEGSESAEDHVEIAIRIFERVGARNDLAKAMVTRAALRQGVGDVATARSLLNQANTIFESLGSRDEPACMKAALTRLDSALPIGRPTAAWDRSD